MKKWMLAGAAALTIALSALTPALELLASVALPDLPAAATLVKRAIDDLKPNVPQNDAGRMTEPPVCVPIARIG